MLDTLLKIILVLIPLAPFLATLFIIISFIFFKNRQEAGENTTTKISLFAIGLSLACILILDIVSLLGLFSEKGHSVNLGNWLVSDQYDVRISFLLDYKSLIMTTLVAFISFIIAKFSVNYLHRELGFQRFFLLLCLFTSAMFLISLSGNAMITFIGWEMAGVSSYLLIAYSWHREVATENASRAFITNRIGDIGFIFAIVLSLLWLETIQWVDMPQKDISKLNVGIILLGFLVAAFAKSAQFPFSGWISRALEGPTPSSAVFYGAIMIHAGVFLLIRLEPLLTILPALMMLIVLVGGVTVTYAYIIGLVQADVKSALLFSTLAQVGLMMIWIGLGWFDLALGHLVVHAIWRTYQFLHAPSYLQQVQSTAKPVPNWLIKQRWLYTAALQRFWLDGMTDWLLCKPTHALSKEIMVFDEDVVARITGKFSDTNKVSSLSRWEEQQQGKFTVRDEVESVNGILGRLMHFTASILSSFEERWILRAGDDGLLKGINELGKQFEIIDRLLTKPRYIIVLIMITFVVVLKGSA